MNSLLKGYSEQVRSMRGILNRLSNFLIYVMNNQLFVKGKDLKYLRNTSHLFIDQIDSDLKATDSFIGGLQSEKWNGELIRLRKPKGTFTDQRTRFRQK